MMSDKDFRTRLVGEGILIPGGVDGLWGRSGVFERVFDGLDRAITDAGEFAHPEVMRFPPAMSQAVFEKSGYMKNFPHFAGTIHCFCGGDADHHKLLGKMQRGEEWREHQQPSDLVLTPAACYAVYPVVAQRGPIANGGKLVDVQSFCFRHEPSPEPTRFQFFRMREFVCIGTYDEVMAFRQDWIERGSAFATSLGLPFDVDVANDPFFGRAGKLMADSQRSQNLKFELLVPINDGAGPTACISFNYHTTYFGDIWEMRTPGEASAHTACCAFGMERLVLALLKHHGFDIDLWPSAVRNTLHL